MSRSARLLGLMQAFRRRRRPVAATELAGEMGVSLRTIYRDIATLVAQGASIEGQAGLGYVLRSGFFLPPLTFVEDEVDALILGLRLVGERGDPDLEDAAENALAKIVAVLPPEQEAAAAGSGLIAGPTAREGTHVATIRAAMRREETLRIAYRDKKEAASERIVWPAAIGFFQASEVMAAWCETRRDFRHFRLDRIVSIEPTGQRMPKRRRVLLAEWRLTQNLDW